jgi:hypothetical protein
MPDALSKIGIPEIQAATRRWFMQNLEITALRISSATFEREKKNLAGSAFEIVNQDTAFWWRKK